jgi:hypothetical protein
VADAADATLADAAQDAEPDAMPTSIPGANGYLWQYLYIDDCAGNDQIPYTTATDLPVGADCNASTLGIAAVCWDQTNYKNSLITSPGCTYKTLPPARCTGGPRPGFMWVCTESGDGAPPHGWTYVGIGDCPGNDLQGYFGDAAPASSDCTDASIGLAAVCWDGVTYKNNSAPSPTAPGCTFKSLTPSACTGGSNPGYMYICNP